MALAYLRQNKWGRGLRLFHFIFTHYNDIDEEQIDFFSFALRKYSLMGFVQMVKLNMKEIGENRNFIVGHAHYLKYAMAWFRSEKLEAVRALIAPKLKAGEAKRKAKRQVNFDRLNAVDATDEIVTMLDLNGTKLKDEIKLDLIAKKLAMVMPLLNEHKELAFGTLLDYYLDVCKNLFSLIKIANLLLAVRAYRKLPVGGNIRNPHKLFLRELRLSLLCKF